MVVYGMECVIAVSATTAGDIGHEKDLTHLKIREQAECVKEELARVAGSLTQLLQQLKHCVMSLICYFIVENPTVDSSNLQENQIIGSNPDFSLQLCNRLPS